MIKYSMQKSWFIAHYRLECPPQKLVSNTRNEKSHDKAGITWNETNENENFNELLEYFLFKVNIIPCDAVPFNGFFRSWL